MEAEQEERVKSLVPVARDVVMVLVKTVKATKLYLPNNPVYVKYREELKEKVDAFFKDEERLSYRVDRFELSFLGRQVYQGPDEEDNIASMFFKDGIREFCFHRGITDTEIAGFVDILKFDARGHELDDDLVTLMWEKDFQNISYTVADEGAWDEAGEEPDICLEEEPESVRQLAELRAREWHGADTAGAPGMLDMGALDDGLEAVRGSFEPPDDLALLTELTEIFYDILLYEKDEERFGTVVESMGRALEIFVGRGDLALATILVTKVRELDRDERLNDRRAALDSVVSRACSGDLIKKVGDCIVQGDLEAMEAAGSFLRQLDHRAVGPVVGLLESVTDRKARKALCDILVEQCAGSGRPLLPFLANHPWYVVRNVVMVLGRVADPETASALAVVLRHPEPRVRREAVQALGQIRGRKAEDLLEGCLRDPSGTNRIFAGRLLADMNPERAFGCFSSLVRDKGFERKPFEEQKEFCELIGRSGREKAVPLLAGRFGKRGFFLFMAMGREHARASAAYGLAAAGGEEAIGLLRSESDSRSKLLRDACLGGLRRLGRVREAEDAG